ncbi:MauE/DoxX family redox-associated membrane protein [Paenibacillus assamensis]|uniref:MauE/DoxX family redox-associated membrane protein n=1 Tax=Paenibacillus assamensis TaxID=311244 RepID=UPI0004142F82|nr:MauE/DoxX family redox-associated membrane protein [Paenibacillus assamensis]
MTADTAITILLSTMFLYSSLAKLVGYGGFKETVVKLQYPQWLAGVVIVMEMLASVLLLFKQTHLIGELIVLGMILAFYFVAGQAIWKKINVSCNCFGEATAEPLGWETMIRLTPLLLAASVMLVTDSFIPIVEWKLVDTVSLVFLMIGTITLSSLWNNRELLRSGGMSG